MSFFRGRGKDVRKGELRAKGQTKRSCKNRGVVFPVLVFHLETGNEKKKKKVEEKERKGSWIANLRRGRAVRGWVEMRQG